MQTKIALKLNQQEVIAKDGKLRLCQLIGKYTNNNRQSNISNNRMRPQTCVQCP